MMGCCRRPAGLPAPLPAPFLLFHGRYPLMLAPTRITQRDDDEDAGGGGTDKRSRKEKERERELVKQAKAYLKQQVRVRAVVTQAGLPCPLPPLPPSSPPNE